VDAYDFWLDGVVDSVAPASGGALSPIPANNATGNFTKIVQRLPVKVRVLPGQRLARLLRAGLSVEVDVDTRLEDLVADQRETAKPVLSPAFGASFPASEPPQ
jgi:membrane fusion protein (multidrug efflux system)